MVPARNTFTTVGADEVPERGASRETPERKQRRAEREEFRAALLALVPGEGMRIDGVRSNLRPTWRGRMRAAAAETGQSFVMRARGESVWFACA